MFQIVLWIIYILGILEHFDTKNYTWRFARVIQNLYEF